MEAQFRPIQRRRRTVQLRPRRHERERALLRAVLRGLPPRRWRLESQPTRRHHRRLTYPIRSPFVRPSVANQEQVGHPLATPFRHVPPPMARGERRSRLRAVPAENIVDERVDVSDSTVGIEQGIDVGHGGQARRHFQIRNPRTCSQGSRSRCSPGMRAGAFPRAPSLPPSCALSGTQVRRGDASLMQLSSLVAARSLVER